MCSYGNLRRKEVWVRPVGANFDINKEGTIRYRRS